MGMNTRTLSLCCVVLAAILPGCASKPAVWTERSVATGIESGEAFTVVLGAHGDCHARFKDGCPAPSASRFAETALERCLSEAMLAQESSLTVVSAHDFWSHAFPGAGADDMPRGIGTLTQSMQDGELRQRTEPLKLRYVITVLASTTESAAKTGISTSRDGFAVGREWKRHSSVEVNILDLRRGLHSGKLGASSTGSAGYGAGVVVAFIPIPFPIFYSAMTESNACRSLGGAVARFITNKEMRERNPGQ